MDKLINTHYAGSNASNYNSRTSNKKWIFEQRIVEDFIMNNTDIESVIDAPLGTNRFSIALERAGHIKVVDGYEYSDDMINEARKEISTKLNVHKWNLVTNPIEKKGDLSLIVRMLNLFPEKEALAILENILVATEKYCILTLRCWDKKPSLEQNKIHVQNEGVFIKAIEAAGFKVIDSRIADTKVAGDYKVMTLSR